VANLPLILDYANLFCGAAPEDSNASNHLVLANLKLPTLEIQYVDHRPGGAWVAVEIDVVTTRMEVEFEIVGITPQIMVLLQAIEFQKTLFHAYGSVRSYLGGFGDYSQPEGIAYQLYAKFRGQLGRVEPMPYRRGDVFHMRYAVRGLMNYELYLADNPIYRWDFFQNTFRVGAMQDAG
jgi:phage tail tube protein FII